jgi:hypothetical protein
MWAAASSYPLVVCPAAIPNPVVYPFAHDVTQNHVFEAILVPVNVYQRATFAKTFDNFKAQAIAPEKIAAINDISLECANGYIAASERDNYQDVYSSKGLV